MSLDPFVHTVSETAGLRTLALVPFSTPTGVVGSAYIIGTAAGEPVGLVELSPEGQVHAKRITAMPPEGWAELIADPRAARTYPVPGEFHRDPIGERSTHDALCAALVSLESEVTEREWVALEWMSAAHIANGAEKSYMVEGCDDGAAALYVWESGSLAALADAKPSRHATVNAAKRRANQIEAAHQGGAPCPNCSGLGDGCPCCGECSVCGMTRKH